MNVKHILVSERSQSEKIIWDMSPTTCQYRKGQTLAMVKGSVGSRGLERKEMVDEVKHRRCF